MNENHTISINPKSIFFKLSYVLVTLATLHVIAMFIWYEDLFPVDRVALSFFDLDEEESFGTWYSALILFFASITTYTIAFFSREKNKTHIYWWILASGLLFMSIDEVAAMHEYLNDLLGDDAHWTTVGIALCIGLGIIFTPFLIALPKATRILFILAGFTYLGGAIGVERATIYHEENDLLNTLGYNLWNTVEEGLEMLGVLIYLYASLSYISGSNITPISLNCVQRQQEKTN